MKITRSWRLIAAAAVLAVAVAGCGDSDGGAEEAPPSDDDTTAGDDGVVEEDPSEEEEAVDDRDPIRLRLTTLLPPGGSTGALFEWWAEEMNVRTDGLVSVDITYGGALVSGLDTLPGLNDGRAEVGQVVPAYYPAEMPLSNVNMIPIVGANQGARPLAFQALYDENDDFRSELDAAGIVLIGYLPNNSSTVALTERIESVDELAGKRVRIPSAPLSAVYGEFGAEAVFLPVEEVYEGLQRGIVDGVTYPFDTAVATGVTEVANYLYPDLGQSGGSMFAMSASVYEGLPMDVREVIEDLRADWYAQLDDQLIEKDGLACDEFLDEGGEVVLWSDADIARVAVVAEDIGAQVWRENAASDGADPEAIDRLWEQYLEYTESFAGQVTYEDGLIACAAR